MEVFMNQESKPASETLPQVIEPRMIEPKQSQDIIELAKALSKAQGEFITPKKDSDNPFFKSKYADLATIWDSCRKILSSNGLCVIQTTEVSPPEIVVLRTMLLHNSGQWIVSKLCMKPIKNTPQDIGSCITYARRYSLSAIVGIAAEDDDGNMASDNKNIKLPERKTFTKKDVAKDSLEHI